jgi:hypothetical protein
MIYCISRAHLQRVSPPVWIGDLLPSPTPLTAADYYELAPIAKGEGVAAAVVHHSTRTATLTDPWKESMTKNLSLRPDMPKMMMSWFDGTIIGWPACLSADFEPAIAKTVSGAASGGSLRRDNG